MLMGSYGNVAKKKKKTLGRLQTLFQDLLVPPEMLLLNQLILVMSKTR